MTTNSPATLRALFDDLDRESARVDMADDASIAKAVKRQGGALEWVATSSSLLPKVAELLDVKLPHIFLAFWQKGEEIAEALRESQRSPERIIDVSLHDCSTEATLSPYIEIRIGGTSPGPRITFTVVLPMTFKAVQLRIKGGALVGAIAGECEMAGEVKLADLTVARLKEPVRIRLAEAVLATRDGVAYNAASTSL